MDQGPLVEPLIDEARQLVEYLAHGEFGVIAACVAKPDESRVSLYIASPYVDRKGIKEAYGYLRDLIARMSFRRVADIDIRLIGIKEGTAQEMRQLAPAPGKAAGRWFGRTSLGGRDIEEGYSYAIPESALATAAFAPFRVKLKTDVDRVLSVQELYPSLPPPERDLLQNLVASGYDRGRAEYWVRRKQDIELRTRPPIPAGEVVTARVAAWSGRLPEDDPNPLLEVATENGVRGLIYKEDTEPA